MTASRFLVPSVLILIASIPLVLGLVPRNRFYGIRTRKTMSDDGIWYPANRFGGWVFMIASCFSIAASWGTPYDPMHFTTFLISLAGFLLPLGAGIIATLVYCRRLS